MRRSAPPRTSTLEITRIRDSLAHWPNWDRNPVNAPIDEVLAKGRKYRYVFLLTTAPPDPSGHIIHFTVTARPQKYGKYGTRSFFADESGVIRFTAEDRAPTVEDPAL